MHHPSPSLKNARSKPPGIPMPKILSQAKSGLLYVAIIAVLMAAAFASPAYAQEAVAKPTPELLFQSNKSWDGQPYRKYPQGKPQLTVAKITAPASTELSWHLNGMPNAYYILSGELTVEKKETGEKRLLRQGEAIPQMMGNLHRGTTGSKSTEILAFYAGTEGMATVEEVRAEKNPSSLKKEILMQNGSSWDGVPYSYPEDQLEISMLRLTIPTGTAIPWHWHDVPEIAYIVSGELTVEKHGSTEKKIFKTGEAFAETMGSKNVHRGLAEKEQLVMIGFFAGRKGVPLLQVFK